MYMCVYVCVCVGQRVCQCVFRFVPLCVCVCVCVRALKCVLSRAAAFMILGCAARASLR